MWLIAENVAREMSLRLASGLTVTEAAQAEFTARMLVDREDGRPPNLTIAGDIAQIEVEGLLTEKPDLWAWIFGFGNTTYQQIRAALAIADADQVVKRIEFHVNSPGGQVAGFFDTLAAVEDTRKPRTVLTGFAASAAYGLSAVAGKITATNAAVEIGSIGVAVSFRVSEDVIDIASTEAPNKRPDVTTPEGKAIVREELDALHELFADAIAHGRGTTVEDVNTNFGRGSVLVAGDARKRGMIDSIQRPALRAVKGPRAEADLPEGIDATAADDVAGERPGTVVAPGVPTQTAAADGGAKPRKGKAMDLNTLKKEHSELCAELHQEGVTAERDRVMAHLTLGGSSGDMQTAVESIGKGDQLTASIQAKYMAASMNRADAAARQSEGDEAGAAADGAAVNTEEQDLGDKVAAIMEAKRGKNS